MKSLDEYTRERFGNSLFACEDHQYATDLKERLLLQGFEGSLLPDLFGVSDAQAVKPSRCDYYDKHILPATQSGDLARLFMLHLSFGRERLDELLGNELVQWLIKIGVFLPRKDRWLSQVSLFWVEDLLIATDASIHDAIWPTAQRFSDRVMYLGYDSVGLPNVAPRTPCNSTLDLCCGSGIQGLIASKYSDDVTCVDLNPRAIRFARFNAALNNVGNIRFLEGDLYEPVQGEMFDAILANPPFVPQPSGTATLLYRDSGATGEDVLVAIFSGASQHLCAEGRLVIVSDLINLPDLPQKITDWWGAESTQTLALIEHASPLIEYAEGHTSHIGSNDLAQEHVLALLEHFEAAGVLSVHFGYLIVRRCKGQSFFLRSDISTPVTRRVDGHVASKLLLLERSEAGGDSRARLSAVPGLQLTIKLLNNATSGTPLTEIEASVPGDPYFRRYELGKSAYDILTTLCESEVSWDELATEESSPIIDELLSMGLVLLSE